MPEIIGHTPISGTPATSAGFRVNYYYTPISDSLIKDDFQK